MCIKCINHISTLNITDGGGDVKEEFKKGQSGGKSFQKNVDGSKTGNFRAVLRRTSQEL